MVALLAERVKFAVVLPWSNKAVLEESVQVPLPMFRVRTPPAPLLAKFPVRVTLLLLTEKSKVPVKALMVSWVIVIVVLTVTVPPPELASKVTVSPAPGTDAPPEPAPDVAAQCVVSEASHVPVPSTQNLLAIVYTHDGLED